MRQKFSKMKSPLKNKHIPCPRSRSHRRRHEHESIATYKHHLKLALVDNDARLMRLRICHNLLYRFFCIAKNNIEMSIVGVKLSPKRSVAPAFHYHPLVDRQSHQVIGCRTLFASPVGADPAAAVSAILQAISLEARAPQRNSKNLI